MEGDIEQTAERDGEKPSVEQRGGVRWRETSSVFSPKRPL